MRRYASILVGFGLLGGACGDDADNQLCRQVRDKVRECGTPADVEETVFCNPDMTPAAACEARCLLAASCEEVTTLEPGRPDTEFQGCVRECRGQSNICTRMRRHRDQCAAGGDTVISVACNDNTALTRECQFNCYLAAPCAELIMSAPPMLPPATGGSSGMTPDGGTVPADASTADGSIPVGPEAGDPIGTGGAPSATGGAPGAAGAPAPSAYDQCVAACP